MSTTEGEKALILGNGALGRELAKQMRKAGMVPVLLGREACDLRYRAEVEAMWEEHEDATTVVNCAGRAFQPREGHQLRSYEAEELVQVNLTGVVNLCTVVIPGMRARGSGLLVHVHDTHRMENQSLYNACKEGSLAYVENVRKESSQAPRIRVVSPDMFKSRLRESLGGEGKGVREEAGKVLRAIGQAWDWDEGRYPAQKAGGGDVGDGS